jgi:transposase
MFDRGFREEAVRIVRRAGKPIAQVARDLGTGRGTLGNLGAEESAEREGAQGFRPAHIAELKRLRAEVAELRIERGVVKRALVLWAKQATR